ncbi:MAG: fasciclin domain-containing protein [Myxococcota bacterium]
MRLRLLKHIVLGLSLALTTAACGDDEEDNGETPTNPGPGDSGDDGDDGGGDDDGGDDEPNVLDVIQAQSELSTLAGLIDGLDPALVANLTSDVNVTIFAPSDEAFANLPGQIPEASLETVLLNHVVAFAALTSSTISDDSTQTTFAQAQLRFDRAGDNLFINGLTTVIDADLEASNGVVHVIDTLLIPSPTPLTPDMAFPGSVLQAVAYYSGLSTLAGAANDAVQDALRDDDITLFAPTNEGFAGLTLTPDDQSTIDTLQYHVLDDVLRASEIIDDTMSGMSEEETLLSGSSVTLSSMGESPNIVVSVNNTSTVIFADLLTSNGVIHVLDEALEVPEVAQEELP